MLATCLGKSGTMCSRKFMLLLVVKSCRKMMFIALEKKTDHTHGLRQVKKLRNLCVRMRKSHVHRHILLT